MKKNPLFFMFAVLFVAAAVMVSCQKEEVVSFETGLMLKSTPCCVATITPVIVDVFGGGNPVTKIGEIKIWNDADKIYLTVGTFDFDKVKIVGPLAYNAAEPSNPTYNEAAKLIASNSTTASKDYAIPAFCTEYRWWVKIEGKAGGTASYPINYTAKELSTITTIIEAPTEDVCVGDEVVIKAKVTANGTITNGTLKIMDGTTVLKSEAVTALVDNTLTFSSTELAAGTYSITAEYVPDYGFCSSVADAVTVTVVDCTDCDEASFDYETSDNLNIIFTYNHGEEVESVTISFTFPQVLNSELDVNGKYVGADGKLYVVNNPTNQTNFTWTGYVSCKADEAATFAFSVKGDCSAPPANDGQAIIWTDATVIAINGVLLVDDPETVENEGPYSLKGTLSNIVYTGCPKSE